MQPPVKPKTSIFVWPKSRLISSLRFINWLNGIALVVLAIVSLLIPSLSLIASYSTIVLSAYVIFLGLMMCTVEIHLGFLQRRIKKNFGFLFTWIGRGIFILFCSSLCFSLNFFAMQLLGALTAANGLLNILILIFRRKDFHLTDDPFEDAKSGEELTIAYLKANPQLISKAVVTTTTVINPFQAASTVTSTQYVIEPGIASQLDGMKAAP
jgi:COPI associated protein